MSDEFERQASFVKVDESLGLVFGWGIVCKQDGVDYYDTQGDHIPEDAMLAAAADFAQSMRKGSDMHVVPDGTVVFSFPMTAELAKAYGIETKRTGLLLAMKPSAEVLAKFKNGEYTGFSIGGKRVAEEVVEA